MLSENLHSLYVPNSYTVVNNPQQDGTVMDSISCSDVGYLESISDHLPVYIDLNINQPNTISLNEGWNLIGTSVNEVIDTNNSNFIAGTIYGFSGTYIPVNDNTLESNKGYWVRAGSGGGYIQIFNMEEIQL